MIIDDTNNCNNNNADDNAVAVDADNKNTSNIYSLVRQIVILMMTVDIYIFLRLF